VKLVALLLTVFVPRVQVLLPVDVHSYLRAMPTSLIPMVMYPMGAKPGVLW